MVKMKNHFEKQDLKGQSFVITADAAQETKGKTVLGNSWKAGNKLFLVLIWKDKNISEVTLQLQHLMNTELEEFYKKYEYVEGQDRDKIPCFKKKEIKVNAVVNKEPVSKFIADTNKLLKFLEEKPNANVDGESTGNVPNAPVGRTL